jgi:hypothetical protein
MGHWMKYDYHNIIDIMEMQNAGPPMAQSARQ